MRQTFQVTIFLSIVALLFCFLATNVLADDECLPPYSGYINDYATPSECESAATYCVLQGSTGRYLGYTSTRVGNSCTLDVSGNAGQCDEVGSCILLAQCDEFWNCTDWTPLQSTKTCGMSFTQNRTCADANNCGTTAQKPDISQRVSGTYCFEGKTCQDKKCVAGGGLPPTNPVVDNNPPAGVVNCPAGQFCNPLAYDNFQDLVDAIARFVFNLGLVVAPIMFVIAGIMFVTSAGDPEKTKTARRMALYTAIGFAIIVAASGLIKVLQSLFAGS